METPQLNRSRGGGGRSRGGGGSDGGDSRKGVGRPSKGPRPVKVPRRGLGVAQLEKLRLEEEQKNAAKNASLPNSPHDMHLQLPNLIYSIQSSPPNSMPSSIVSFANNGGSEASCHDVPILGHMSGPQIWAPHGFEFEKNFIMDPRLAFPSSLPSDSNSIRPLPNWVHTTQPQQQQQYLSSLMISASSGASSSTIVGHSSIEHPSNQNYSGSYVSNSQEEKMIGFKRANPFSLDIPPISSSNSAPLTSPDSMKAKETFSFGSGRSFNLDFGNSTLREILPVSASNTELISKKIKKENKTFGGDYLTLAPPTQCSHSKLNSPSTSLSLHCQGNMVDQDPSLPEHNQFNQQKQYWYNFIPPAAKVEQIGEQSYRVQNRNETRESIDLDLKL